MADDALTRPLATVTAALIEQAQRRAALIIARDRREQDMLRALSDVEDYERHLSHLDQAIEDLFDERARAIDRERAQGAT